MTEFQTATLAIQEATLDVQRRTMETLIERTGAH